MLKLEDKILSIETYRQIDTVNDKVHIDGINLKHGTVNLYVETKRGGITITISMETLNQMLQIGSFKWSRFT